MRAVECVCADKGRERNGTQQSGCGSRCRRGQECGKVVCVCVWHSRVSEWNKTSEGKELARYKEEGGKKEGKGERKARKEGKKGTEGKYRRG